MSRKPIGPKLHGAIDYGFFTIQTLAPGLFGLEGTALKQESKSLWLSKE